MGHTSTHLPHSVQMYQDQRFNPPSKRILPIVVLGMQPCVQEHHKNRVVRRQILFERHDNFHTYPSQTPSVLRGAQGFLVKQG